MDDKQLALIPDMPAPVVPPARAGAPETSALAALSMLPYAGKLEAKVAEYVDGRGDAGATADEVQVALNLEAPTVTARLWRLSGKDRKHPWPGLSPLVMTDRTRKTRSGRNARVYLSRRFFKL